MEKSRILIIEDNFPLKDKKKIQKATDTELVVIPTYEEGRTAIKSVRDYNHVITGLSLDTGTNNRLYHESLASIIGDYIYSKDKRANVLEVLKGVRLNEDLTQVTLKGNVINYMHPKDTTLENALQDKMFLELLEKAGGLDIAYNLYRKSANFTIYAETLSDGYPSWQYLVGIGIVPLQEYLNVLKQSDYSLGEGKSGPHISPTKRLAKGLKESPNSWMTLLNSIN